MDYIGVRVISGNTVNIGGIVGAITDKTVTLKAHTEYMLQFKIINYGMNNTLNHIVSIKDGVSTLIVPGIDITTFPIVNIFEDEGITKQERLCYVTFKPTVDGVYRFGICRTLTVGDKPNVKLFDIRQVSCERGIVLQDFKDNSQDLQDFIRKTETYFEQNDKRISMMAKQEDMNRAYAKIEVTSSNILLEVNKKVDNENIIASINLSPETIKINAENIDMTGNLDLNGTFRCFRNGTNKSGHYLYQSGAMIRGYLEGWEKPVFSAGLWRPDNINDVGYVSVGWSNSDNFDSNGCLYMSPIVGGGGSLSYGKLISEGVAISSGFDFLKEGYIRYNSFVDNKEAFDVYGHRFDSGISAYSINGNFANISGPIKCNSTLYTSNSILYLGAGGYDNKYTIQIQHEGYMYPTGNTQLGTTQNPFYKLVSTYPPELVSDIRKKKDIHYIDNNVMTLNLTEDGLNINDMYNFIRNDLKLATYKFIDCKEEDKEKIEIGFIAQDILNTKVGKYIVNDNDPNNLVYDMANRISVLEGALQVAIEKIELLQERILLYEK